MLKLIADSGSTKTDWVLINDRGETLAFCKSHGLNPYHLSDEEILETLRDCVKKDITRQYESFPINIESLAIYFYGSGVTEAKVPVMASLLRQVFDADEVLAASDMLGAARAVLGHQKGIAVILGTGSNSCLYDGEHILDGVPPLGYILGDEGSGTAIGKAFFRLVLRNPVVLPLKEQFMEQYQMEYPDVIEQVYRKPLANRFLASVSSFVGEKLASLQNGAWKTEEEHAALLTLQDEIVCVFDNFVQQVLNLYINKVENTGYVSSAIPVGLVGSIAYYFKSYLQKAMENSRFVIGEILKSPMEGLIRYHTM